MDFLIKSHGLQENDGGSITLINHSYAWCHAVRKTAPGSPPANASIMRGRGNLPGMQRQNGRSEQLRKKLRKTCKFSFCKEVSGNTHKRYTLN